MKQASSVIDLTGKTYGRLTVISRGKNDRRRQARWWCRCECGLGVLKKGSPLRRGEVRSCGCLELENRLKNCGKRKIKHGLYEHPLYYKFQSIIARCYREGASDYTRYGGRGIKVCDEWRGSTEKFIHWAIESGWEEGKNLSVDRIDNDGHYCPENCRIITCVENTIKRYTDRGQGLVVAGAAVNIRELTRQAGVSPATVKKLSLAGYSSESIISYGKLKHYQKIAVENSIKEGNPMSIDEALKVKRKEKVRSRSPGYVNYNGMKGRCYNESDRSYSKYGGRGIKVCEEWRNSFEQFILDMGEPPHPDAAVHRMNNDGDYSPSNCVWVSRSENTRAMHTEKLKIQKNKISL